MMRVSVWIGIGCLWLAPTLAAAQSSVEAGKPQIHNNACSLAESMAGKLGYKGTVTPQVAQQSCQVLAPNMGPEDRAEFLRCCIKRLAGDAPAKQPQQPDKKPPRGI